MKMLTEAQMLKLLREAYLAGWNASGQGYNAEVSYCEPDIADWQDNRDAAIAPLIHADSGGYDGKGRKA